MSGPGERAFGRAWITAYFAEVDRMAPDDLLAWYAQDGRFRFAGQPTVQGKAAIGSVLAAFYASLRSMRHRATGIWVDEADASGVFEAEVDFVTAAGRALTLPAVSVLRLKAGRVHDFRFVMDPAPLFAERDPT